MFESNQFNNTKLRLSICLCLSGLWFTSHCQAGDLWSFEFLPQLWYGSYQDSLTRDSIFSYGFFTSADYLERGGVTFGYNQSSVAGKAGAADVNGADIEETAVFLSGHYTFFTDALAGKITVRLDGYSIKDKNTITETTILPGGGMGGNDRVRTDSTTYTDNIAAGFAQISFFDHAEKFYLDVGYAMSSYDYDSADVARDNDVQQFTPTAGLAFNEQYDWLQARVYIIRLQHGDNTNNQKSSNALELQWTHWFNQQAPMGLNSFGINTVIGERISAVDPDAGEIYSLSDRQNNSISIFMNWQPNEQLGLSTVVGYDEYTDFLVNESDTITDNDYSIIYVYVNVSILW
jgi:hypothetical protein